MVNESIQTKIPGLAPCCPLSRADISVEVSYLSDLSMKETNGEEIDFWTSTSDKGPCLLRNYESHIDGTMLSVLLSLSKPYPSLIRQLIRVVN